MAFVLTVGLNQLDSNGRMSSRSPVFAVALALVLWPIACVHPLLAAEQLSLGTVRASPGTIAQVPLNLSAVTSQPAAVAMQADIVFDARSLVSAAGIKGNLFPGQVLSSSSRLSGTRRLLIYSLNNAPLSAGVLATFPFAVSSATQGGSIPLVLTNVILANAAAAPVASVAISGSITLGVLNPILARPDGNVDVFLNAGPGQPYILQASTNFVQWVDIFTNASPVDILPLTDQDAHLYPHRFYRAVPTSIPSGVVLSGVSVAPNGTLNFHVVVAQSGKFILQATTNLTSWVNLQTNTIGAGANTFSDSTSASFSTRFYRLVSAP